MTRKPALVTLLSGVVVLLSAVSHIVHHHTGGLAWVDIVLVIAGFLVLGAGAMAFRAHARTHRPRSSAYGAPTRSGSPAGVPGHTRRRIPNDDHP